MQRIGDGRIYTPFDLYISTLQLVHLNINYLSDLDPDSILHICAAGDVVVVVVLFLHFFFSLSLERHLVVTMLMMQMMMRFCVLIERYGTHTHI